MDDTNVALAYDSSGNKFHGTKESITANTFHYEGSDVPYSWQNGVGYSTGLAFDANGSGTDYDDSLTWIGDAGFTGDFSIDWVLNDVAAGGVIGFENDTTPTPTVNFNSQPYNVQITATGLITRRDGVTESVSGLTHFDGDVVTIARSGTDVTVSVNGVLRKTWTGDSGDQLYPALSLANTSTLKPTIFLSNYNANYAGANVVSTDEFIPRDESNTSFDVLGNPLQYGAFVADDDIVLRDPEPKRAYSFDGGDDIVNIAYDTDLNFVGGMTVSMWYKSSDTGVGGLLAKYNASAGQRGYGVRLENGNAAFYYQSALAPFNADNRLISPDDTNDGDWHHFVGVFNPSTYARIYTDGSMVAEDTTNIQSAIVSNGEPLIFGLLDTSYYDGELFDVRLYNKVLTNNEIEHVYNFGDSGTDPGIGNLVAHYKMDDTNADTAYDSSGNDNHGTKENITASTFHYEGADVPYSWQNEVGYSLGYNPNGSSDCFDTGFIAPLAAGRMEAWVTVPSGTLAGGYVAGNGPTGGRMTLGVNSPGRVGSSIGSITSLVGTSMFTRNQNYKLSLTWDGTNAAVLVNDIVENTGTYTSDPANFTSYIGCRNNNNTTNGYSNNTIGRVRFADGSNTTLYDTRDDGWGTAITTTPSASYIPRDESNITKDIFGNPLQYFGPSS